MVQTINNQYHSRHNQFIFHRQQPWHFYIHGTIKMNNNIQTHGHFVVIVDPKFLELNQLGI